MPQPSVCGPRRLLLPAPTSQRAAPPLSYHVAIVFSPKNKQSPRKMDNYLQIKPRKIGNRPCQPQNGPDKEQNRLRKMHRDLQIGPLTSQNGPKTNPAKCIVTCILDPSHRKTDAAKCKTDFAKRIATCKLDPSHRATDLVGCIVTCKLDLSHLKTDPARKKQNRPRKPHRHLQIGPYASQNRPRKMHRGLQLELPKRTLQNA